MTPRPRHDRAPLRTGSRSDMRHRRTAPGWSGRTSATSGLPAPEREQACADVKAEDLWDRHGASAYALACVLLGDAAAAARAVELGMADLAQSAVRVSPREARRFMAQYVYKRSQELSAATARTLRMPPTMTWLSELAQLQRACLALCLFGAHTHREAAALLGVAPTTAAALLTSGLTELGRRAATEPVQG